jgi:hypothetical protein
MRGVLKHVVVLTMLVAAPVIAQSNVDPSNKHAWAENIGWTNWRDAGSGADGVVVGSSFLSGRIWSESDGWIDVGRGHPGGGTFYVNADGADFGVNIGHLGSAGDLDGFAWGENTGWINFGWAAGTANPERARFDSATNRFRGYAWGENTGWINLDDGSRFVSVGTGVPTVSEWGLVVLTLLTLSVGTILFGERRAEMA